MPKTWLPTNAQSRIFISHRMLDRLPPREKVPASKSALAAAIICQMMLCVQSHFEKAGIAFTLVLPMRHFSKAPSARAVTARTKRYYSSFAQTLLFFRTR